METPPQHTFRGQVEELRQVVWLQGQGQGQGVVNQRQANTENNLHLTFIMPEGSDDVLSMSSCIRSEREESFGSHQSHRVSPVMLPKTDSARIHVVKAIKKQRRKERRKRMIAVATGQVTVWAKNAPSNFSITLCAVAPHSESYSIWKRGGINTTK